MGREQATVALLTGGIDKPYVLGLTNALTATGFMVDVVGSDDLEVAELLRNPRVNFLNLRGDQRPDAGLAAKVVRLARYYLRLMHYAAAAKPQILHILWNNKIQTFDRTVLMLYYKLLGKKIVLTAHNVNAGSRDSCDSVLNRITLKSQYFLSDAIFVHTRKSQSELLSQFGVPKNRVCVIPFGINNTLPTTRLSAAEAKNQIGVSAQNKTLLFFGQIAPYKGLEYLVDAFGELLKEDDTYRLIIAGNPKWRGDYWESLHSLCNQSQFGSRIIARIEYVPDAEAEIYFKAADALVLPYTDIFQSGVLFLGYSFGLPVLAADVGSLKEEIVEGETGFVFKAKDSSDLAKAIRRYFLSELYLDVEPRRSAIQAYANDRYSWDRVASVVGRTYSDLLGVRSLDAIPGGSEQER